MNNRAKSLATDRQWPLILAGAALLDGGCRTTEKPVSRQVGDAWAAQSGNGAVPPAPGATPTAAGSPELVGLAGIADDAIAYVDGQPISRTRMVELLLAGHGVGILEQLVVLERAKGVVAEQGLVVTQADVDAEYERSLRNLLGPLESAEDGAPFDWEGAERVLDEVLARRNLSRAECMAMVSRNAFLRAIVRANMSFTDAQLREEFERCFGPRVEVRHIQLASLAEAERVLGLLRAGDDFASLATRYSANPRTAPGGGLLRPFSAGDAEAPAVLRDAAFRMEVGEVSNPIRVDDWHHVIRIERKLPPEMRSFAEVRPELEERLRERLTAPAMQTLYGTLFEQADIHINDPILAAEFARKHPRRARP